MLRIDPATREDVPVLNAILAALIAQGDNTALEHLSDETFSQWFLTGPTALFCLVARNEAGEILGFQTLSTYGELPSGWADIGTFARADSHNQGIGSALLAESQKRLLALGFSNVNATVRADNAGGLKFYRKMGFVPYETLAQVPLHDGRLIDRISHRLELKYSSR